MVRTLINSNSKIFTFLEGCGISIIRSDLDEYSGKTDLKEKFKDCSSQGTLILMQKFIDLGFDIRMEHDVLIVKAVKGENYPMVEFLLKRGLQARALDNEPFKIACKRGYDEIKEILLKYGAIYRTRKHIKEKESRD